MSTRVNPFANVSDLNDAPDFQLKPKKEIPVQIDPQGDQNQEGNMIIRRQARMTEHAQEMVRQEGVEETNCYGGAIPNC